jgi:hypothetical protein
MGADRSDASAFIFEWGGNWNILGTGNKIFRVNGFGSSAVSFYGDVSVERSDDFAAVYGKVKNDSLTGGGAVMQIIAGAGGGAYSGFGPYLEWTIGAASFNTWRAGIDPATSTWELSANSLNMMRLKAGNSADQQNFYLNGGLSAATKTAWGVDGLGGSGAVFRFVVGQSGAVGVYENVVFEPDTTVERTDDTNRVILAVENDGAGGGWVNIAIKSGGADGVYGIGVIGDAVKQYRWGMDVSDAYAFVLAGGQTLGANTILRAMYGDTAVASGVPIYNFAIGGIPSAGAGWGETNFRLSVKKSSALTVYEAVLLEPDTYTERADTYAPVYMGVQNDSQSGPGAQFQVIAGAGGGAYTGGDASVQWSVRGNTFIAYTAGMDVSDSLAWVLSASGALGTNNIIRALNSNAADVQTFAINGGLSATTLTAWGVGGAGSGTVFRLTVPSPLAGVGGSNYEAVIFEPDTYIGRNPNYAGDGVMFQVYGLGDSVAHSCDSTIQILTFSGRGDPYLRLALRASSDGAAISYVMGIDDSDGNALVISAAAAEYGTPGTGNILKYDPAAVAWTLYAPVTMPRGVFGSTTGFLFANDVTNIASYITGGSPIVVAFKTSGDLAGVASVVEADLGASYTLGMTAWATSVNTTGTIDLIAGAEFDAIVAGDGNVNKANGAQVYVAKRGTGTLAVAAGLYIWPTDRVAGTITLNAGIYIEDQATGANGGGTSNYQIYSKSAKCYFGPDATSLPTHSASYVPTTAGMTLVQLNGANDNALLLTMAATTDPSITPDLFPVYFASEATKTGGLVHFNVLAHVTADMYFGGDRNTLKYAGFTDFIEHASSGTIATLNHYEAGPTTVSGGGAITRETGFYSYVVAGAGKLGFLADGAPIGLKDGIAAPATITGVAQLYVDVADGFLKVKFGGGTVVNLSDVYTDEKAQDAVGTILTDTATIDFTYNDAGNTISAIVVAASIGTTQLAGGGVTYAKIQNVSATDMILGRATAGAGVVEEIACTAAGRALIDDTSASAQRTTLGLGGLATLSTVGTTELTASGVTYAKIQNVSATDKVLGRSTAGAGVVEEIACTSAGRALIDDADAAAQRTTLGVGTADSPTFVSVTLTAPIKLPAPVTTTAANYTLASTDSSVIFNRAAGVTATLPAASTNTGKVLFVKTIAAGAVTSASSNVVPTTSATAGTAILAATAGKWAILQSDGTNWITMAAN